ncbi:DUF1168 domain protein [Sphaerosporella brunnea]|uniref:DUF1168 domain protein n=1 Tax=Sphaerosporella brunnea TaxID=1250544 RepID=A0A5J5EJ94_9PEZI|nr:DUF1168 domain protein [Sphaerosporella brunnea]
MSEPGPASIPTSADPRSKRPTKRRALSPTSAQASASRTCRFVCGAGSGEFHVYKASRRREYERLRLMDEQVRQEEEKREFERKMEELKKKDEEKTNKNRKRRMKKKEKANAVKADNDKQMMDVDKIQDANDKAISAANQESANNGDAAGDDLENAVEVKDEGGIVIHDDD